MVPVTLDDSGNQIVDWEGMTRYGQIVRARAERGMTVTVGRLSMSRPPGEARGLGASVQAARLAPGWTQSGQTAQDDESRPTRHTRGGGRRDIDAHGQKTHLGRPLCGSYRGGAVMTSHNPAGGRGLPNLRRMQR